VDEKCIDEAAEAINKAERPVILAGGGVSIAGANKELFELQQMPRYLLPQL